MAAHVGSGLGARMASKRRCTHQPPPNSLTQSNGRAWA
jgi:hypothetical protein